MKYTTYLKLLLGTLLISMPLATFAQLSTRVERVVSAAQTQAQQLQQAAVTVTATLKKPVKMSDMMCRPVRGCKDQIISYETKTNTCRGTLEQGGQRVYVTADCVSKKDYALSSVKLQFSNGKVAMGTGRAVSVKEDVAYVAVKKDVTRGLHGLAFSKIPKGQSLQKTFGNQIEDFLLSFFRQKGVPSRGRCRIGGNPYRRSTTVKVGEPVIYRGKVIALVRQIPSFFRRGIFGGVSESPLAIIRF